MEILYMLDVFAGGELQAYILPRVESDSLIQYQ